MALERVLGGWDSFRRPLRKEDREAFDGLMKKARRHSSASSFNVMADPNETMFMSILLEQEKEVGRLKARLEELLEEKEPRGDEG
jgi:hypothetical protein